MMVSNLKKYLPDVAWPQACRTLVRLHVPTSFASYSIRMRVAASSDKLHAYNDKKESYEARNSKVWNWKAQKGAGQCQDVGKPTYFKRFTRDLKVNIKKHVN